MPKFPSAGFCIYCSGVDGLTDEHIIPLSLGGRLILPDASCAKCSDVTKRFEQVVARDMYWRLRMTLGIASRRKKSRPTHWPSEFQDESGAVTEAQIEVGKLPEFYVVPRLLRPGICTDRALISGNSDMKIEIIGDPKKLAAFINGQGAGKMQIQHVFAWGAFSRLIAKVGHAFAAATLGNRGVEFVLPKIVLGETDHAAHWIGEASPDNQLPDGYDLGLYEWIKDDETYLCVGMTFFGSGRFPVYEAVVGKIVDFDFVQSRLSAVVSHRGD